MIMVIDVLIECLNNTQLKYTYHVYRIIYNNLLLCAPDVSYALTL